MLYSKRAQWVTPVGIELTFMSKEAAFREEIEGQNLEQKCNWPKKLEKQLKKAKIPFDQVCHDCGFIVEVSSPILKEWDGTQKWYTAVKVLADKNKFETMDRFYATGGGHIHFDVLSALEAVKLYRDFAIRPYLNWFFNDICDNCNANNPLWGKHQVTMMYSNSTRAYRVFEREKKYLKPLFEGSYEENLVRYMTTSKNRGLRYVNMHWEKNSIHMEMRIFRAPFDWEEQQTHINFLQAYVAWAQSQEFKPVKVPDFRTRKEVFTFAYCVSEFNKLLEQIGLDPRDYERFHESVKDRISFGKKWLY